MLKNIVDMYTQIQINYLSLQHHHGYLFIRDDN